MYSENVAGIQVSNNFSPDPKDDHTDFNLDAITVGGEYAIYKNIAYEYNEIIRGIYQTNDLFHYSKYIKTGRFFNSDDYKRHTKTAVIGNQMLDVTYMERGKRYYGYEGVLYEVIGIFKQTNSNLDHAVYLNLSELLEKDHDNGLYYVDSYDKTIVNNVIQNIIGNLKNKCTTSIVEYESQAVNIGLGLENRTLLICIILSVVFNLIITLIYFVASKKYTTAVQKLCGMNRKDILMEYGMKMLCRNIWRRWLVIVVVKCLSGKFVFLMEENLSWKYFIMAGVTMAVMGIFAAIGIVHSVQRVDISDTLKGR